MGTLSEAYDIVGGVITLIGNIQYDGLRSYKPEEMRETVPQVLTEAEGRRFLLSPSAGPCDEEMGERMKENYIEFMNAGWGLGVR